MKNTKKKHIHTKLNNMLYFLAGALMVGVIGIIAVGAQTKNTRDNVVQEDSTTAPQANEAVLDQNQDRVEKWQEGLVSYKGKQYVFDEKKSTYLLMGIDNDGVVDTAPDCIHGGQSDAMFLLVVDEEQENISVISINRNTMTEVTLCDEEGNYLGEYQSQICVQHAFGEGKRLSCIRSKEAVEKLFYNTPINGYVSINMGGVAGLNDAIGGVEVTVLKGLDYENSGLSYKEGDKVTLDGQSAYRYLRGRDLNVFDSATDRLRRQEQYVVNYMNKLKGLYKEEPTIISDIYRAVGDYTISDVDFVTLAKQLIQYDFSMDNMYTVPGQITMGESGYEEYYVDQEAFYDLVIQLFYREVAQ